MQIHPQKEDLIAYLIIILLSINALSSVMLVPFHPDESTYLYMSTDLDTFLSDPFSLQWNPNQEEDPHQKSRELDAPLIKYLLGISRKFAGMTPLKTDWDWSKSWEENKNAGALPSNDILHSGRFGVSLLFPLTLLSLYHLVKHLTNSWGGIISIIFLGTNALILLHTRRAMAEGALVFGITLSLFSLLKADKYPWLTGIAIALAFNAKQTSIALLPAGLLAVCWIADNSQKTRIILRNAMIYVVTFLVVTFLLNPLIWRNPLRATLASIKARQELVNHQVEDTSKIAPQKALETPTQKIAALIAQAFIAPPSFSEIGNYLQNTSAAEQKYISVWNNTLWRGFFVGGFVFIFSLLGLIFSFSLNNQQKKERKREIILLVIATLFQAGGLITALPLPWQRYYMPLFPFIALWFSIGIYESIKIIENNSLKFQ